MATKRRRPSTSKGAPPETMAKLRDKNEERHRTALAAGSPFALQTERRRQQAAARAADPASGGIPPAGDATPPPDPPQGDAGARPSIARRLLREGLTALIRPPRSG